MGEEITRNENDIFKYGFPPSQNIWVKTHLFFCTTSWDISMGEQIGINMALELPYSIHIWGDNLNTINDTNRIANTVNEEIEDSKDIKYDENTEEVLEDSI